MITTWLFIGYVAALLSLDIPGSLAAGLRCMKAPELMAPPRALQIKRENSTIELEFTLTSCVTPAIAASSSAVQLLLTIMAATTGVKAESISFQSPAVCSEAAPPIESAATGLVPATRLFMRLVAPARTSELGTSITGLLVKPDQSPGANVAFRTLRLFNTDLPSIAGSEALRSVRLAWAIEREHPIVPENAARYALALMKCDLDGVLLGVPSKSTIAVEEPATGSDAAVPGTALAAITGVVAVGGVLIVVGLALMVYEQGGLSVAGAGGKVGKLMSLMKKPSFTKTKEGKGKENKKKGDLSPRLAMAKAKSSSPRSPRGTKLAGDKSPTAKVAPS